MKPLNNKGYVLVEVLIVTAFVMASFVFVYQNTVPQMGEYEKIAYYDDIDSVYGANLLKQLITRYGNTAYIDKYLQSNSYINMNNCNDKNLYINADYCQVVLKNLSISSNDYIFVTDYDISNFRSDARDDEKFDSGRLSNFLDYLKTVPDIEPFYSRKKDADIIGKYRLFVTRTVTESDGTSTMCYANIGVYTGEYQKYTMGELVKFDPGTGEADFYVLKNSSSTESTVTLILANNLPDSTVTFNSTNTANIPDTALNKLKTLTDSWINVDPYSSEKYSSEDGYTISYYDYRARLIDEFDIMDLLGCKEDSKTCFDYQEAFTVNFDTNKLAWLVNGLDENTGYWTGSTIPGSNRYAWSVQKGRIAPNLYNEATNLGIRPIITISKSKLGQ